MPWPQPAVGSLRVGVRDTGNLVLGFRWKGGVPDKECVLSSRWHECWPGGSLFPRGCGQCRLGPGAGKRSGGQIVFAWV